jgi:hypothetical protein
MHGQPPTELYVSGSVTILVVHFATNRRHSRRDSKGLVMYRIIYKSIACAPFSETELKKLLVASRLRNAEAGLTGMLIYDRETFLQMLEGDMAPTFKTFARIERDPRHKDISVLLRDPNAADRAFGDWSMGYAGGSTAASILKGFVDLPDGLRTAALDRVNAVKILAEAAKLAA